MSRHASKQAAIGADAEVLAVSDLACAQMTPREQAEAAWTPTSPYSVAELEVRIRVRRGGRDPNTGEVIKPKSVRPDGT